MMRTVCFSMAALALGCGSDGGGSVPAIAGSGSTDPNAGAAPDGASAGQPGPTAVAGAGPTRGPGSSESGIMPTGIDVGAGGGASGGPPAGGDQGGASGLPAPIVAACSEAVLRTGPPEGKEAFRAEPNDARFPFSTHWMGIFNEDPRFVGMTAFADLDHDGDLDFVSGQREDLGGGMIWWEYCSPDHWVRHPLGTGHRSWAAGFSADMDGDGWVDVIAGDSWYRNPQNARTGDWDRFNTGGPKPEEIIISEVTGDDRPDVLYIHRSFRPLYFSPGADPTAPWVAGPELANAQQQGGAIGDLDGDGDNDILVGYRWWYRNVNGDGSAWETVTIFQTGFDEEPLTYLGDLDGDGDTDIVMGTHFGERVAWGENLNGVGTQFELHSIATDKSFIHAIVAADFDNDGDLDVFAGQNVGPAFIFENSDGAGTFLEHTIAADTRSHDARVADVDCDGDLDIAGKPWGDLQHNESGENVVPPRIRDHVYLQNMLVENGGLPLFDRKPYEVFPGATGRICNQ